MGCIQKL